MDQFQREINRLSNLKQNKGIPVEELEPVARINLAVRKFKQNPLFPDKKEQSLAEERFKTYLEVCEIESESDLDTLASLVYNEVFEKRIQKELNKLNDQGKYPPDKLTKQLTEVQNQKLSLKVKLGIDRAEEEKDDLTRLQLLEKRVFEHIQKHKHEHTIFLPWTCEKCGHKDVESYLVWYKVEDFKVLKHPWFQGRFLFNYEILKDVKDGKLSKEDAWRYMICAGQGDDYDSRHREYCTDYIDYCLENWEEIVTHFSNR